MRYPSVHRYDTPKLWRSHVWDLFGGAVGAGSYILISRATWQPTWAISIVAGFLSLRLIFARLRLERQRVVLFEDRIEFYRPLGRRKIIRNEDLRAIVAGSATSDFVLYYQGGSLALPGHMARGEELLVELRRREQVSLAAFAAHYVEPGPLLPVEHQVVEAEHVAGDSLGAVSDALDLEKDIPGR